MGIGLLFLLGGLVMGLEAFFLGGLARLLYWPALAFVLTATGYLGVGPVVLGKRPDGTIAAWA